MDHHQGREVRSADHDLPPEPWQPARDERGASATEYGLLITGIAALIVAVVFVFGGFVQDLFNGTCGEIASETSDISCASTP